MRVRSGSKLLLSILLAAAGAAAGGACTVETTSDQGDAAATTTGSSSSTTGGTGTTGASSTGASTGTSGSDGGGTTGTTTGSTGTTTGSDAGATGSDGGSECLGDSLPEQNPPSCSSLTYADLICPGDDAGQPAAAPFGARLCNYMQSHARVAVFSELYRCLKDHTELVTPCGDEHVNAVFDCVSSVFDQACEAPPEVTLDGGATYGCAEVANTCAAETADAGAAPDGGEAGATSEPIDRATCQKYANGLDDASRVELFTCFQSSTDPDCNSRFNGCVLNFE